MMYARTILLAILGSLRRRARRRPDDHHLRRGRDRQADAELQGPGRRVRPVAPADQEPGRREGDVLPAPEDAAEGHPQRDGDESIPVEVRFPKPAASVTLVLWGSIGSEAVVEAYDADGNVVDRASRDAVPERTGPEQPIPSFELTVKAPAIASVRFSGAPPGGYLVCDEVRFTPRTTRRTERAGCPPMSLVRCS